MNTKALLAQKFHYQALVSQHLTELAYLRSIPAYPEMIDTAFNRVQIFLVAYGNTVEQLRMIDLDDN